MTDQSEPSDRLLGALVRAARPAPPLPPRFREAVWQRLESAQAPRRAASVAEWLDRAAAWLLRPGLALAGVAALLLVGTAIGVVQGTNLADERAKQQYLTAVSPLTNR